jgi:hypothetical protein
MSAPTPPPSPRSPSPLPLPRIAESGAAGRRPGNTRLSGPPQRARRAELAAALGLLVVLAHLLLAQVTLVLAVLGVITGRVSRWRPLWLAVPAVAGAAWTAQLGVGRAVTGLVSGPRQVLAYLAGAADHPERLARPGAAFSGAGHWVPAQLPVALLLAAGEVAAVGWLGRGGWLGASAWPADYRPGLIVALRRRRTVADLAAGEVVTRAGCALGLETATGRPAEIAWSQAQGGVLSVGAGHRAAALAALPLACAAARRHQTLIVIDLAGRPWLGGAVADACAAADIRLARLGPYEPGPYEPGPYEPGPYEPGPDGPGPDGPGLGRWLDRAVSERTAVLLVAGPESHQAAAGSAAGQTGAGPARHQPVARPAARRALAELTAALRELGEEGLRGDGLAWIHGITAADQPDLAGLPALGAATGIAVLLSTADEAAATALAEEVRVVVAAGPVSQGLETMLRGGPLLRMESSPGPMARSLSRQDEGEFTIFERGQGRPPRPGGQLVAGPWAGLT